MLNIIDRYIVKSFLGYFVGGLLLLTTLFVAIDAMSMLASFKASNLVLAEYYLYSLPAIVYQFAPAAALIGTIFTLMDLNKNNELVALFSLGMSLARVSSPILIVVSLLSVISFVAGDRLIPLMNQKKNYVFYVDLKKQPDLYSTVKTNKIWYRSKNIIFNLRTLNPETLKAQGASFYYFDEDWHLIQTIVAHEVTMSGSSWTLENGVVTLFQKDSSFPLNQPFRKKSISIFEKSADIQNSSNSSDVLSVAELRNFIKKNKEAGLDTLRYEVDYHAKFGFAFASFVMAFLGVPFSVRMNRSGGRVLGIGICLGLAFGYWTLYSSGLTLGRHGVISPILSAWIPNVVMIFLTFLFLLRLRK